MVQKEVNKKLPIYGFTAILLAVLLVASIYSLGISPSTQNQGPLNNPNDNGQASSMMTFSSLNALETFLKTSTESPLLGSYDA